MIVTNRTELVRFYSNKDLESLIGRVLETVGQSDYEIEQNPGRNIPLANTLLQMGPEKDVITTFFAASTRSHKGNHDFHFNPL